MISTMLKQSKTHGLQHLQLNIMQMSQIVLPCYTLVGCPKLRKHIAPSHWPQSQCRRLPASLSSTVQVPSTLGVVGFRRGRRRAVVAKLCCRLNEIPKIAEPKHLRKGVHSAGHHVLRGCCHSNSVASLGSMHPGLSVFPHTCSEW